MKKFFALFLVLLFFNVQAIDNEIFSLKDEITKFVLNNRSLVAKQDWTAVSNKFKSLKDTQGVVQMYMMMSVSFPLISRLDDTVQANRGWTFIKAFNLERDKILLEQKINSGMNQREYDRAFEKRLDDSTFEQRQALERKAIEEAFEILALKSKEIL